MVKVAQIRDIMTAKVLTVKDTDTLDYVAGLFEKYDYDGLPVVDSGGVLKGIITAYDMVVQSSGMHLPTLFNIMDQISVDKADKAALEGHFNKLKTVKASEIMNSNPLTVKPETLVEEAAKEFAQHHKVNPIVVVDANGKLAGVVSRYDIIRFFNEKYFNRILEATGHTNVLQGLARANVEKEVQSTVGALGQFLLVGKIRPRIWKIIAISAFIAGFIGSMALIIRIVKKSSQEGYNYKVKIAERLL